MNEISFQAVQYAPRLISVITLLLLTLLVAKFSQSMVLRAACQCKSSQSAKKLSKKISNISFWAIIALFSPFILGATGLDASWLRHAQVFVGQFFSNWPIWMLMSVIVAGVSYLFHNLPRFYLQLKGSPGSSSSEF